MPAVLPNERRTPRPQGEGLVAPVAVVVVLAVSNVASNRLLPDVLYVPWNLAIAGLCVWIARGVRTREQMGFTRWAHGAAWGAVLAVLTAGCYLLALAMPVFNEMFHDNRVHRGVGTLLYHTVIRIPLGTVVLEEVAFRGVLPALANRGSQMLRGSVVASVLFGAWHVLPALTLNHVNPVATRVFGDGVGGVTAAVVFAVAGTALAGLWWCWVRYRSGSVLATMIAHVATNSLAYLIAWLVGR